MIVLVDVNTLRRAREYAESIVATVREPLLVLDGDLRVTSASRSFYSTFQTEPQETEGLFLHELGRGRPLASSTRSRRSLDPLAVLVRFVR